MYKVDVKNSGGYVFTVRSGAQTVTVDAKSDDMTPPGMLLAGLASCVGVYIRKYAEGAKLDVGDFEVTAEADLTKDPPFRFAEIKISVILKTTGLDDRRLKSISEFVKNCPVHNTIKGGPEIKIEMK
ncbi:MAG: OsmC family protein [Candidatus Omnitrophica bacterium]|nr:OsmC family protein [Candidatus Omnitrophota bacterium]